MRLWKKTVVIGTPCIYIYKFEFFSPILKKYPLHFCKIISFSIIFFAENVCDLRQMTSMTKLWNIVIPQRIHWYWIITLTLKWYFNRERAISYFEKKCKFTLIPFHYKLSRWNDVEIAWWYSSRTLCIVNIKLNMIFTYPWQIEKV